MHDAIHVTEMNSWINCYLNSERLDVFLERFCRQELANYLEPRFSALGEEAFSLLWLLPAIDNLSEKMITC